MLCLLSGQNAQLKAGCNTALQMRKSEVIALLARQTYLQRRAKSARHKKCRQLDRKHKVTVKKLRGRLVKQEVQITKLKTWQTQQAQHAQRTARLQHQMRTGGLDCYHKLTQLAEDVIEGNVQHLELRSHVRANSQAQDLLVRLAGVVDELRTQLQVCTIGIHDNNC